MAEKDRDRARGGTSRRRTEKASKKASKSTPSYGGKGRGPHADTPEQKEKEKKAFQKSVKDSKERKTTGLKKEDKKTTVTKEDKKTTVIKEDKDLGSISKLKEEYEKYKKGDYDGDPFAKTKKEWEREGMVSPGEHKLRTQYNRLLAKKGPGWAQTTQAKQLLGYLAGVPVERGGFLGGRDPEYGGGRAEYDTHGVFITEARRKELEAERQRLLDAISKGGNIGELLANVTREGTGADLTPDQFYNFTQQLMASDPSYGNLEYKKARSFSSGAGIPAIGKALVSPYSTAATGILKALGGDKKTYGVGTGADPHAESIPVAWDMNLGDDPIFPRTLNRLTGDWYPGTGQRQKDFLFQSPEGKSSKIYGPYDFPMDEMMAEGEELSFPIYGQKERRPEYTGEALDPALLRALKERGEILDPFAREEGGQELAYDRYGGGGGGEEPPPDDDTPPGDENQWMTADASKIGKWNPNIDPITNQPIGYGWGTMEEYLPFAEAKDGGIIGLYNGGYLNDSRGVMGLDGRGYLNNSNGVIGLDDGGYINDYQAADSLMFKDPQEDEEWEYNV